MRDIGIIGYVIIILLLVIVAVAFIASKVHVILTIDVDNSDLVININVKYLFNLINIKKQLYPPKINYEARGKVKKIKIGKIKTKLALSNFLSFYRTIEKIEVYEIYSKINYGSEIFSFTSFMYVFINSIYGYIANLVDTKKLYLGVNPDYTKNYIKASIRFHAIPSIRELVVIVIAAIKISHKNKEAAKHESDKFNTKSYGDNC